MNNLSALKVITIVLVVVLLIAGLRVVELYTQLSRYQNYWDARNRRTIQNQRIDYVALGDSAAQGVGASKPDKGYVGLIQQELSKRNGGEIGLVNLSKSGAKIRDVLDTQLPAYEVLIKSDQVVVTVEIGANDITNFDAQRFEQDMDQLMARLPKQTIISDIPNFSGSRLSKLEKNVTTANNIMYRLAEKHGFTLVPLHERTKNNRGLLTFGADLFHPSNKGYRENWAPVFLQQIKED